MTDHRLPVQQLAILAICRFAEPIALTSVLPYIPELMESFGVPENDIARVAGIVTAIFSLCQASTGLLWGAASDRYGRKPIIIFGLFNTMWAMLLWGFSVNLPMAITARALQGLTNGNVGILRTTVAELCPWKELQPRAFSIMPLVYTVGAIIGPTMGGALSNPLGVDPRAPRGSKFLEHFPYILPNLVAAAFFTMGIVVGWLFLEETLKTKRNQPDLGLRTGAKLQSVFRKAFRPGSVHKEALPEHEPLLASRKPHNDDAEARLGVACEIVKPKSLKIRDVLNHQTALNLVVYFFLAVYTMAYDQLLPVYMHHPTQSPSSPNIHLPLKFAGGFGIDSRQIGIIFTFFSIGSTLSQFLLFPPFARSLGILPCLRISFLIFPVVFFITPFINIVPDPTTKQILMVILLTIRGLAGTFAFPTSTIMMTNSASSLQVLGTINGLATSVSAVGRAIGPAIGGGLFTWGVKRGYVIVPFWALSLIAVMGSVPAFWLVEGKGFGAHDEGGEESFVTHGDEETCSTGSALLSASEFAHAHDPSNLLGSTTSHCSVALASETADDATDEDSRFLLDRRYSTMARARSQSQGIRRRRSSVPIGLGKGLRRYSYNLGSTGVGGPGASWGGA